MQCVDVSRTTVDTCPNLMHKKVGLVLGLASGTPHGKGAPNIPHQLDTHAGSHDTGLFAAVGGGTVTNVGIQDICPPAMCDDHDLTIILPASAATFYQAMTARLTFKYTWPAFS